jgi:hypothetical protein
MIRLCIGDPGSRVPRCCNDWGLVAQATKVGLSEKKKSELQGCYAKVGKEVQSDSATQKRVWGRKRYSWELEQRCLGEGGLMTQGMSRGWGHDMCQDLVERECVS